MVRVTIDTHFCHNNRCKTRFQKQQTVVKGLIISSSLDGIAEELMRMPVYNVAKSRLERLPKRPFL